MEFLIDRQFGQAIWIDVENGIVQNCYNEAPKFNARMNELYKGKTITFFKEDFKKRMKGTVQIFHPVAVISFLHKIEGAKTRIAHLYNHLSNVHFVNGHMCDLSPAEKQATREKIKEVQIEQYSYEKELSEAINNVECTHGFDCSVYKKLIN